MKTARAKILSILLLSLFCLPGFGQIRVDPSKSFLQTKDGKPFFWMGDTGWELFHRLSREEVICYLDARQKQGFNVIMAVTLGIIDEIIKPNYYGDLPFKDLQSLEWAETPGSNPSDSLGYDYWDHVDFVIREAAKRKMYIGLLPAWGDNVVPKNEGPVIFTNEQNSYRYARKLAERYRNQWNIIWILGGDSPAIYYTNEENKIQDYRPVWRAMARAIRDVYGNNVFITYHPGWHTSGYFQNEDWLKMHTIQSGHGSRQFRVWDSIRVDLQKCPNAR